MYFEKKDVVDLFLDLYPTGRDIQFFNLKNYTHKDMN